MVWSTPGQFGMAPNIMGRILFHSCAGGSFNITATYVDKPKGEGGAASEGDSGNIALAPQAVTITGSVVCGQDTIVGKYDDGRGARDFTVALTQGKYLW